MTDRSKRLFLGKKNLLFSKRALPYERFLFFTEYNLISKKVIENSDAYYPHYKKYLQKCMEISKKIIVFNAVNVKYWKSHDKSRNFNRLG